MINYFRSTSSYCGNKNDLSEKYYINVHLLYHQKSLILKAGAKINENALYILHNPFTYSAVIYNNKLYHGLACLEYVAQNLCQ